MDSANPLEGWPIKDIRLKAPFAKNDIYGTMFNYVQELLSEFCHRIENLNICFQFFQVGALKLPSMTSKSSFDRIEVKLNLLMKI